MSFSGKVKEEISTHISKARHCKIAEISAVFAVCGQIIPCKSGRIVVKFSTENLTVASKYSILVKTAFNFNMECRVVSHQYQIYLVDDDDVQTFLKALKIIDEGGSFILTNRFVSELLLQRSCCKRAFLRGIFLVSGSVTDPKRGYHLEVVAGSKKRAEELRKIMKFFDIDAKIVERKKNYVVYLKEGTQIADMLNVMEAHVALMELENVRIFKEMRNSINRQVNCETANIKKTVSAAAKQMEDIVYIRDHVGYGILSEGLAQMAKLRIEHTDSSLKELGEMLDPPIGKSGVNHRLRKLSEIADGLRQHKEEKK
ncbi:MAG: DNA-binding protein WhiA [Lachnospiraceae bacterium]|nr:DNA-binding protein WhiA [Lachnospiraceae bacterium]